MSDEGWLAGWSRVIREQGERDDRAREARESQRDEEFLLLLRESSYRAACEEMHEDSDLLILWEGSRAYLHPGILEAVARAPRRVRREIWEEVDRRERFDRYWAEYIQDGTVS